MIDLRPQPVGIFPFPADSLLLPPVPDDQGALAALLNGDASACVPDEWAFFTAAIHGSREQALSLLPDSDAPLTRFNRFVLQPTQQTFDSAAQAATGPLRTFLDVSAYTTGFTDAINSSSELDGELLAASLAAQAAAHIEQEQTASALNLLQEAAAAARPVSPLYAALLLAQRADLTAENPERTPAQALQDLREALALAENCRLPLFEAQLLMKTGMLLQDTADGQRSALLEAVRCYQAALQKGMTQEQHPRLFGQLQNNLGLAWLSMPAVDSSHQLRTGIAVQSFRYALKVFTKDQDPDLWASVSMNLANALQYAPSSHPEQNLIQAVEIYEDVLSVRTRARDPESHARVLLNQANALAHLGMFRPAVEKLSEAYRLFHCWHRFEEAAAAEELLDQISRLSDQQKQTVGTSPE